MAIIHVAEVLLKKKKKTYPEAIPVSGMNSPISLNSIQNNQTPAVLNQNVFWNISFFFLICLHQL